MSYAPTDIETIRDQLLDDYRNQVPGANTGPKSEIYARATLLAGALAMQQYGLKYVENQIFPDSADYDNVVRHASLYGLTPKVATAAAEGTVRLTGVNSTVVSSGLTLTHDDGTEVVTTSGGTITGGILDVTADAVTTGTAGNKVSGDELTVQSPPAGVDPDATVLADFDGGTDDETKAALADRVIQRMRKGNAGGTHSDYEQWALAVDGVLEAHTLEMRNGPGTVSVAVYSEDGNGNREPANAGLRADVLTALNAARPVTDEVDVPSITEVSQDVTVVDLEVEAGFDSAEVVSDVEDAIEAFVYSLETGGTLFLAQLGRAIGNVDGVRDWSVTTPAANVEVTVDESNVQVLIPGTVSVTAA